MISKEFNCEELHNLVWSSPMTSLVKKYLISDSGLRKICWDIIEITYNIKMIFKLCLRK